jgi:glucokinase
VKAIRLAALPAQQSYERYPLLELAVPRAVIAFDIGGTDIKIGVVDGSGAVLSVHTVPTELGDAEKLLDQLVACVRDAGGLHPGLKPAAIGIHVAGLVDDARGVLLLAENLGLRDVAMKSALERRTGLPIAFGNDARGAGFAEVRMGAARGFRNAMVVSVGTGIGAAVFVDGRAYSADGFGCELGHMRMVTLASEDSVVCNCGGVGCLETYCSARGIANAYARATGLPARGAREVFAAAAAGDHLAHLVIERGIDMLALALAQVTTVLSPEAIVIAGGLSEAGDALFIPLRTRLDEYLTFHRRPLLLKARFGDQSGVIASALRASELLASL